MAVTQREKGYQKYAWVLPLVAGLVFIIPGVLGITEGCAAFCGLYSVPASTPAGVLSDLNGFAQERGIFYASFGVFVVAVASTGFRRGQRWAWYAVLWFFAVGVADLGLGINPIALTDAVLSGLGLLLLYGKVFPKKQLG